MLLLSLDFIRWGGGGGGAVDAAPAELDVAASAVLTEGEIEEAIILGYESDNRRRQWLGSIRGSLRNLLGGTTTSVSRPPEEPLLASTGLV